MAEERRWAWMAALIAVAALLTAAACGLDDAWVPAGLFAMVAIGMLDMAWLRMRRHDSRR